MQRLKPKEHAKLVWVKKAEPSYGHEAGETYYQNINTKETVWERPEEYWSDGEDEVDLDDEENSYAIEDLAIGYETLSNHVNDKSVLLSSAVEIVHDCLNFLLRCVGDSLEEIYREWQSLLSSSQPSGFFIIFYTLTKTKENKTLGFGYNAVTVANTLVEDRGTSWREVTNSTSFVEALKSFLAHEKLVKNKLEYLTVVYHYLSYATEPVKDQEIDHNDPIFIKVVSMLTRYIFNKQEPIYLMSCKCYIAILALFQTTDSLELFKANTLSRENLVAFKEAFLSFLNDGSTINSDKLLQSQTLECGKVLLANDVTENGDVHDGVFNVQDANIITDICLLSINNLDPSDAARCDFLMMLSLNIASNSWRRDCHKYDEIKSCLTGLLDPKRDIFLKEAIVLAKQTLDVLNALEF